MQQRESSSNPFGDFRAGDAAAYESWYSAPGGRGVVRAEEQALAAMLRTLPPARSVLEVGCGSGHFTRWLAACGMEVVGVDPSPGMLRYAHLAGGSPRYIQAIAEDLPFATASVDVVLFITTLEFVGSAERALSEAARVARSGLVLGVLNLASPLGLRRKLSARVRPSVYRAARFYTVRGLQRLLRRALPERVRRTYWTTAVWPRGVPSLVRRLPAGAFIALAAPLRQAR